MPFVRMALRKPLSTCSFPALSQIANIWNDAGNIFEKLSTAKQAFPFPFFMEVVMIGAWCIWKERNALIFNGKAPNLSTWKIDFKQEARGHLCRIKTSLHDSISSWLDAL